MAKANLTEREALDIILEKPAHVVERKAKKFFNARIAVVDSGDIEVRTSGTTRRVRGLSYIMFAEAMARGEI
jgi:hypothetical protein